MYVFAVNRKLFAEAEEEQKKVQFSLCTFIPAVGNRNKETSKKVLHCPSLDLNGEVSDRVSP